MKREFYECNQIARLLMFGGIKSKSEPETGVTRSGKRYRVDTDNRYRGKYMKTFVENNYIPMLSESESEREDNP